MSDDRAALVELLALWERFPDPELARAIEIVGERAARDLARPDPSEWLDEAARRDPVVRHHLVATVHEGDVQKRLGALADGVIDPRVDLAVIDAYCRARYYFGYPQALELLGRTRDPRVVDRIDELERVLAGGRRAYKKFIKQVRKAIAIERRLLDEESRARVASLVGSVGAPAVRGDAREADLLEAIYANPLDDGPREIYADWLIERSDPRGEYIMLALVTAKRSPTGDELRRMNTLERAYLETWFPTVSRKAGAHFSRGFLSAIFVDRDDACVGDPALATIEVAPHMLPGLSARGLTKLTHANLADLVEIGELAEEPPLVELVLEPALDDAPDALTEAYARLALPRLRRIRVRIDHAEQAIATLDWLLRGRAIEEVQIYVCDALVATLAEAVRPTTVRTLSSTARFEKFVVRRDDTDRFGAIEIDLSAAAFRHDFERLAVELEAFPTGTLSSVRVTSDYPFRWTIKARKRVAACLARHPGVAAQLPGYDA